MDNNIPLVERMSWMEPTDIDVFRGCGMGFSKENTLKILQCMGPNCEVCVVLALWVMKKKKKKLRGFDFRNRLCGIPF